MSGLGLREERWVASTAFHVQHPDVGQIIRRNASFVVTLPHPQDNWLQASIPAPDVTKGWKVESAMLRYQIGSSIPGKSVSGMIDVLVVNDGERTLHNFTGLNIGLDSAQSTGWKTLKLDLPVRQPYMFGLQILFHIHRPPSSFANETPTMFEFASAGLGFTKDEPVGPLDQPVTPTL